MNRHELPMLAGIAGFIRWVEELANLLSGPLLTLGLGLALVDLLTDGKLLASVPLLLYVWATTQAVGVDAQLVAMWDKAHIALRERRFWSLFALVVLGIILAYVAWVAAQVFALQESEGVTTAQALARLGFDSAIWLVQRTALSVFLVCLAGWTRYHAPAANVALSAQEERERLEADLALEPLRQQKRAMQLRGARGALDALRGKETPVQVEATPAPSSASTGPSERPPTGPGSPARKPRQVEPVLTPAANVVPMQAPRRRKTRRKVASNRAARGSVEPAVRAAFTSGMGTGELMRLAGVSKAAASKWRGILQAEADAAQASEQAAQ